MTTNNRARDWTRLILIFALLSSRSRSWACLASSISITKYRTYYLALEISYNLEDAATLRKLYYRRFSSNDLPAQAQQQRCVWLGLALGNGDERRSM